MITVVLLIRSWVSTHTLPLHGGRDMSTSLTDRLHTFLTKAGRPVSLPYLKDRTKDICTYTELLDALQTLTKGQRIKVTIKDTQDLRGGTAYYSIKEAPKPRTPGARYRPTTEEEERMDREVQDFWEHSPLVSDKERECYYLRMTDRNRYKSCDCSSCVQWRWMLMTREERAVVEVERMRTVLQSL